MKLPFKVPKNFRIIAHRGASGYAPENTLAAFRLAERMGVAEIELDIWLSQDNRLVICHDKALDRYGYPGLQITDLASEALLSLDMGSWFSPFLYRGERMLTLEALFLLFSDRFIYHIEIKDPRFEIIPALVKMIESRRLENHVFITSKYDDTLIEVQKHAIFARCGWILTPGSFNAKSIERAVSANFFQICPRADEVDQPMVAAALASLPEVRAYGVKGIADVLKALEANCDGLTINWPDWLTHGER